MIKLKISVSNLTTPESVGVNCESANLELEIPVEEVINAIEPLHQANWAGIASVIEKLLTPEVTKLIEDQFKPAPQPPAMKLDVFEEIEKLTDWGIIEEPKFPSEGFFLKEQTLYLRNNGATYSSIFYPQEREKWSNTTVFSTRQDARENKNGYKFPPMKPVESEEERGRSVTQQTFACWRCNELSTIKAGQPKVCLHCGQLL